jgi:23S rRNA (guanosine2251-2'-O)-methyltransferase
LKYKPVQKSKPHLKSAGNRNHSPKFAERHKASGHPEEPTQLIPIPGRRPIEELLQKGIKPEKLLVALKDRAVKPDDLVERCRKAGWHIEYVDRKVLDDAAEILNHQGYLAFINYFPYINLDRLISEAGNANNPMLIALDQVQDAGNLGAILRSAECAGVMAALIPFHRAASVTAAVIRSSAGAALHLPICRVVNLSTALDELKNAGMRIVGMDQEGNRSLYETDLRGSLVMVVGSESHGLRPGIKRRCDDMVSIPLKGRVGSLNASVAAAVCLYEAVRQRAK